MYEMRNLLDDLKAEFVAANHYRVKSDDETNQWKINVRKDITVHNESTWQWSVDGQLFDCDEYACDYLKTLAREKQTKIRIIYQDNPAIPDICGDGSFCDRGTDAFTMLCTSCPKAHKIEADKDCVTIEYRTKGAKSAKKQSDCNRNGNILQNG